MIRISCGNLGSGKTLSEVREMAIDKSDKLFYSNIHMKKEYVIPIKKEFMFKEVERNKKTELRFNKEFWMGLPKPLSIVLDESHLLFGSRRSMSRQNIELGKFVSMARRICGQDSGGYGELVFITQLPYTIDKISRDLCTEVRYHVCHYVITCQKCGRRYREDTEQPDKMKKCPACGHWKLKKSNLTVHVRKFSGITEYEGWKFFGQKTFYDQYLIRNPEQFFPLYDTHQWEDIFEDYD